MGYVYFVSFVIPRHSVSGMRSDDFGNLEVTLPQPLTSIHQLREIEGSINPRAVILFFQYLREDLEEEALTKEEAAVKLPLPLLLPTA